MPSRTSSSLSQLPVAEIRAQVARGERAVTPQLVARLRRDRRRGARELGRQLAKRYERAREEELRLDAMLNFERVLWKTGKRRVAGVDEAGVGPLAGPVVAAAVVFAPGTAIAGVDDSKRLDPERREELAAEIAARAAGIGVGVAEVEEIDRINIYQAALLAMRRAVEALPEPPEHVLVDAREIPGLAAPQNPFDKGDGINYSIAAASIVAKTHRDRLMDELDQRHEGYGFARHKGYCTAEHQEAVRRLGPCAAHRRSFTFLKELTGGYSDLFYTLQSELYAARDAAALTAYEATWRARRAELAEPEQKKLLAQLRRAWRLV